MDTTESTPTPEPRAPASGLAGIVPRVKEFFDWLHDAARQARKARIAALAGMIAQAQAHGAEVRGFDKTHGSEIRSLDSLMTAPEIRVYPSLAVLVERLTFLLGELRRGLSVAEQINRLVAAVKHADTDEALDHAEACLRWYAQHQYQRSAVPGLERLLKDAQATGERLASQIEVLRRNPPPPVTVLDHPAESVEYPPRRPEVRQAIVEFDTFNYRDGGAQ